jgi:hypothetical protein
MAVYNTASDSANTAIMDFLAKISEFYIGHPFNAGGGNGRTLWFSIRYDCQSQF